jgi:hypothetical protein
VRTDKAGTAGDDHLSAGELGNVRFGHVLTP